MKVLGKFPQSLGLASLALCRRLFVFTSLFLFSFETRYHVAQAGLQCGLQLRMTLNFQSSCLYLRSVRTQCGLLLALCTQHTEMS